MMKLSNYFFLLGSLSFLGFNNSWTMAANAKIPEVGLIAQSNPAPTSPDIQQAPVPEVLNTPESPLPPEVLDTPESQAPAAEVLDTPESQAPVVDVVLDTPESQPERPSAPIARQPVAVAPPVETQPESSVDIASAEVDYVSPSSVLPTLDSTETRQPRQIEVRRDVKRIKLGQLSFLCGADDGTPATIARVKNRDLGIILWVSELFASKGYDKQTRCKQVSTRFEEYNKKQSLAYITIGKLNGQPVICVTSTENGKCGDGITIHDGLLFTLKPESNFQATLDQLAEVLQGGTEEKPLKE